MPGLVVRMENGDLKWYLLFKQGNKYTFFPSKDQEEKESGRKVGDGFNFAKYLTGYWKAGNIPSHRRRIGGGTSLICIEKDGDLKHYPFLGGTFMVKDAGEKVGSGFSPQYDYYVAEWTNRGMSDMVVRDDKGDLRLFPWNGTKFTDLGRSEKVGEGFTKDRIPDLYPAYWNGGSYPDLLAREKNGDLQVYAFNGKTFRESKPRKVGMGFGKDFTRLLVDEWMGDGNPDIIAQHKNGKLTRYPYGKFDPKQSLPVFANPPYVTVGEGFKDKWTYIVGHWRTPGKPDLMVCDDDHELKFYPFDGQTFVDLPKDDKVIGKGFKCTHFWDFYP